MVGRLTERTIWDELTKGKDVVRILFQNVNGIPEHGNTIRSKELMKNTEQYEIDVWGLADKRVIWKKFQ